MQPYDRVMSKTVKTDTCWLYTGKLEFGYGRIRVNGKKTYVHRIVFEYVHGYDPEGLDICHTCDVRNCVNPEHLFEGTRQDNVIDMYNKGRGMDRNGENNPLAELTEDQVRELRSRPKPKFGEQRQWAKEFNVSDSTISLVLRRKIWKHIE